jgi:hypothetical protein
MKSAAVPDAAQVAAYRFRCVCSIIEKYLFVEGHICNASVKRSLLQMSFCTQKIYLTLEAYQKMLPHFRSISENVQRQ